MVRTVDYFKVKVPNRAGQGARVLGALKGERIDLLAILAFPVRGGSQIDLVPRNTVRFRRAARKLGLRTSPRKAAFLIGGSDRIGAIAGVLRKLAAARINVVAVAAARAGGGRYGGLLWVRPRDVGRARRALRAR